MKLPWDRNYLKISFHVIFTLVVIYALALIIGNMPLVFSEIDRFFAYMLNVLSPLIIAVIFSYIMNPVVERLQGFYCSVSKKAKKTGRFQKRTAGTILLYLIIFFLVVLIVSMAVTGIGGVDIEVIEQKIRGSVWDFVNTLKQLNIKLSEMGLIEDEVSIFEGIMNFIKDGLSKVTAYFAGKATHIGSFLLDLLIGLTASFYFLMEKERILYICKNVIQVFMPKKSETILNSLSEANNIFSGYISGQITDAIVMATLISISFLIIGIDYPLIIGIISGFSNLIPYVGAIVAFVLAISVALIGGTPMKALYAAIVIILLQQLDSAVIVPKIVGNKVKMHPVFVILSLSVFGALFGIVGMIFAVPVTALMKSLFKRIYNEQRIRNIKKS